MLKESYIHNSIQKHFSSLTVPVFHYFNIELVKTMLEKGEVVIVWQRGRSFSGDKNHPRIRVLVNVLCKTSSQAHSQMNDAVDALLEIMKPMTGFDILGDDPTITVGKFVIVDYIRMDEFVDKDGIGNIPITFELTYPQIL